MTPEIEEQQAQEIEKATLPEASLAYLNTIEDSLAVLTSHITNAELEEAQEILALISTQTTEFRSLILAEKE